jgi:glycosyltransferase involved in cell wall biosynthesis
VWVPSELDVGRQHEVCSKRTRIRAVPNALDLARYSPRQEGGSHDIVLAGDFGYAPNMAGAKILRDQVLPAVRQVVPDARLILVGRDRYGQARELQREPDVVVTGEVPDTHPYLCQAGVITVPILHGGGTRYKILEALALALPVVSTPLGAEGLEVRDGEHLLIRDIDQFAEAIVSILLDPAMGQELGHKGRQLIESCYSWEAAEKIMRASLIESRDTALPYASLAKS